MRLKVLHESEDSYRIALTRSRPDFKQIKKLDGALYGGSGYSPPVSEIVVVAKDGSKLVGYAIAKPYRAVAYCRRLGVDPDYEDSGLKSELVQEMLKTCKKMGFEFSTTRSSSDNMDKLNKEFYGDPVSSRELKKGTAHRFRVDLKGGPPAAQGRVGPPAAPVQAHKAKGGGYA